MNTRAIVSCSLLFLILNLSIPTAGQRRSVTLVCKRPALAALKSMPALVYPCDEEANDWDEKILKRPARLEAIKSLTNTLSSFTDAAWWTTDTVDLNVCDFNKQPGVLTSDQRHDFTNGEYPFWLFGNDRIRLVLIPDPCYQTQYGGSNAFLLYRHGNLVSVIEVLDGYFSRADNPMNLAFAKLNAEELIEISTWSGGLNPSLTNYYFAVDPRLNRIVPKNFFHGDGGPSNQISSALLLGAVHAAEPLKIFRGNSLARSFVVYADDEKGKIDDNGRTLSRKTLRFNGRVYR